MGMGVMGTGIVKPPITLLVMAVGSTILFDPTRQELNVADIVLAISVTSIDEVSGRDSSSSGLVSSRRDGDGLKGGKKKRERRIRLVAIRTIDTPARLTAAGVLDKFNPATGGGVGVTSGTTSGSDSGFGSGGKAVGGGGSGGVMSRDEIGDDRDGNQGVWHPPLGGVKRGIISRMIRKVVEKGGVAEGVLDALESFQ